GAVIDQLQSLRSTAARLSKIDTSREVVETRLQSVIIELKDLEAELSDSLNKTEHFDEQQKQAITELVDKYNHVLVKHRCTNEAELKQLYLQLQNSVSDTETLREKITVLEKELEQLHTRLNTLADQLHNERNQAIPG